MSLERLLEAELPQPRESRPVSPRHAEQGTSKVVMRAEKEPVSIVFSHSVRGPKRCR